MLGHTESFSLLLPSLPYKMVLEGLLLETDSEDEKWKGSSLPSSEGSESPTPLKSSSPIPPTPLHIKSFFSPFHRIKMPETTESQQTNPKDTQDSLGDNTQSQPTTEPAPLSLDDLFALTEKDRASMDLDPQAPVGGEESEQEEPEDPAVQSERSGNVQLTLLLPHYDKISTIRPIGSALGLGEGMKHKGLNNVQTWLVNAISKAKNKHVIWKYKTFHDEKRWVHADYKGYEDLDDTNITLSVSMASRPKDNKVHSSSLHSLNLTQSEC